VDDGPQAEARGMTVKAEAGTLTCAGKDGKAGTVMPQIARGYDEAEIQALAAYFAKVSP